MTTTTIAAWLLTYLLHSTIILSAVLAISKLLGWRNLAVQETLLRIALVGGVVTASLQMAVPIAPVTADLSLDSAVGPFVASVIDAEPVAASERHLAAGDSGPSRGPVWAAPLVVFWAAASMLALVAVLRSILDLRRLLRSRCFQTAGRLVESLAAAMGLRQRVRVSTSKAVAVPFATGIRRPEICCPERVDELAIEHKRSLFAHELAHLARRDPAWQLGYRLSEALLVLQPLNRLARRRLEELAEHLADDRAAASTGDRLGLARCLVVVAHWGRSGSIGLPATALAAGPRLDRRVRRLISRSTERRISSGWAAALGVVFITGSALLLPAVASPPVHAESAATAITEAKTWSDAEDRPTDNPPAAEPAPDVPAAPKPLAEDPAAAAPPAPPSSVTAPAPPEAAPDSKAHPAPEIPPSAPAPETTSSGPNPHAAPAPPKAPEPATPAPRPSSAEGERRREEARSRASERAREEARTAEIDRARAEARARHLRESARAQSERAREFAREAEDRTRLAEREKAEMQIRTRQLQGEARRIAREAVVAQRERSEAVRDEARARARESSLEARQLAAEQRESILERSFEMRERAAADAREAQITAEERARELADRARALAEQAEAERREKNDDMK